MTKLYAVGFGPGDEKYMTGACRECLGNADVIVGYTGYLDLLRPLFPDKEFYDTGMTRERSRCEKAIEIARGGKTVCVVSSGDSGVYGMAGLLYELAADVPSLQIEVVPGITAAISGAALLGAPIGHDFAVISLSDLLTSWATIERRLRAAASGDFIICLYNPGSNNRPEHLRAACDILLEILPKERICGIAGNIGREGQSTTLTTLGELRGTQVTMTDTVFIGNSFTLNLNGKMVTPRGYRGV
jgi:precorrin-3B C17-methyltransferase